MVVVRLRYLLVGCALLNISESRYPAAVALITKIVHLIIYALGNILHQQMILTT